MTSREKVFSSSPAFLRLGMFSFTIRWCVWLCVTYREAKNSPKHKCCIDVCREGSSSARPISELLMCMMEKSFIKIKISNTIERFSLVTFSHEHRFSKHKFLCFSRIVSGYGIGHLYYFLLTSFRMRRVVLSNQLAVHTNGSRFHRSKLNFYVFISLDG